MVFKKSCCIDCEVKYYAFYKQHCVVAVRRIYHLFLLFCVDIVFCIDMLNESAITHYYKNTEKDIQMTNIINELEQFKMVEQSNTPIEVQPESKKMSAKQRIAYMLLLEENIDNAVSSSDKAQARKALQVFKEELKVSVKKKTTARKLLEKMPVEVKERNRSEFKTDSEFAKHRTEHAKYLNEMIRWNRETSKVGKAKFTVEVSETERNQFKEKVEVNNTNINQLLRSFVVSYINGETAPVSQPALSNDPFLQVEIDRLKADNSILKREKYENDKSLMKVNSFSSVFNFTHAETLDYLEKLIMDKKSQQGGK